MAVGDPTEETEALIRRLDVLDRLCRSPAQIRDLVEEIDHSRRTITRAITELEEIGLVERGSDGVEATTAGRLSRDRLRSFLNDYRDVLAAQAVLDPLPAAVDVDPAVVGGAETIEATDPEPYEPLERIHELLVDATCVRMVLPTLEDPRTIRLLYELVVTDGHPVDLIVTSDVFETLESAFPRRMAAMAATDRFRVAVGSPPRLGVGLIEAPSGIGESTGTASTTAYLLVFNRNGALHGAILNDGEGAVEWTRQQYDAFRAAATNRTDELRTDSGDRPERREQ